MVPHSSPLVDPTLTTMVHYHIMSGIEVFGHHPTPHGDSVPVPGVPPLRGRDTDTGRAMYTPNPQNPVQNHHIITSIGER